MTQDNNRMWFLLSRKVSGAISIEETEELDKLLEHDPEAWYTLEVLSAMEETQNIPPQLVHEIHTLLQHNVPNGINIADDRDNTHVGNRHTKRRNWTKIGILACFVFALVFMGGYYWSQYTSKPVARQVAYHEISATNGTQARHTLPDGTKVRLNAGSQITYAKNFMTAPVREIHLVGEAYFDVMRDEQRPFAVHTSAFVINNIGTAFNVKAYPDDPTTEATLIEGAIEVMLPNAKPNEGIRMKPREKLTYYNQGAKTHARHESNGADIPEQRFTLTTIEPDVTTNEILETAWMDDKIIFRNEIFGELAKKLERHFNVNIIIENEEILNCPMTGFFENENLTECLETLQLICTFKYTMKDNSVYITHK